MASLSTPCLSTPHVTKQGHSYMCTLQWKVEVEQPGHIYSKKEQHGPGRGDHNGRLRWSNQAIFARRKNSMVQAEAIAAGHYRTPLEYELPVELPDPCRASPGIADNRAE